MVAGPEKLATVHWKWRSTGSAFMTEDGAITADGILPEQPGRGDPLESDLDRSAWMPVVTAARPRAGSDDLWLPRPRHRRRAAPSSPLACMDQGNVVTAWKAMWLSAVTPTIAGWWVRQGRVHRTRLSSDTGRVGLAARGRSSKQGAPTLVSADLDRRELVWTDLAPKLDAQAAANQSDPTAVDRTTRAYPMRWRRQLCRS